MHLDPTQLVELRELHQPAVPDDGNAVAHALHLRKHVRREKHCGSVVSRLFQQGVELLLVERIEAARRLVEDQQVRLVHEGQDDGELLLVAARVFAEPAAQVQLEPLGDRPHALVIHTAAQPTQVGDDLAAAQAAELRHVAGQVADLALDLN